jgi:hypothetical protein
MATWELPLSLTVAESFAGEGTEATTSQALEPSPYTISSPATVVFTDGAETVPDEAEALTGLVVLTPEKASVTMVTWVGGTTAAVGAPSLGPATFTQAASLTVVAIAALLVTVAIASTLAGLAQPLLARATVRSAAAEPVMSRGSVHPELQVTDANAYVWTKLTRTSPATVPAGSAVLGAPEPLAPEAKVVAAPTCAIPLEP